MCANNQRTERNRSFFHSSAASEVAHAAVLEEFGGNAGYVSLFSFGEVPPLQFDSQYINDHHLKMTHIFQNGTSEESKTQLCFWLLCGNIKLIHPQEKKNYVNRGVHFFFPPYFPPFQCEKQLRVNPQPPSLDPSHPTDASTSSA